MTDDPLLEVLAAMAVWVAGATPWFLVFFRWFDFWRERWLTPAACAVAFFVADGVAVWHWRRAVLAIAIEPPRWAQAVGVAVVAASFVLSVVADRQLGLRVRSFTPFFVHERIRLRATGAYRVVRHPIYAAGIYYQCGVLLMTGSLAVAIAWVVLTLGALGFTRQEERRLAMVIDDPAAYERYRARVPRLFPWPRGRAAD